MRNLLLHLSYDGTNYHGFQIQQNAVTIQQKVEEGLSKVSKEPVTITGCSRTDTGVHASDYVCNFKTNWNIPPEKIPFALNAVLPGDISCISGEDVSENFHARFSTNSKIYSYNIYNAQHRNPLICRYSWHYPPKLDFDKMSKACEFFVGMHDFKAFMATGGQQKTTTKEIYSLSAVKDEKLITINIHANSYLYNMVRIIVGTLVYVGNGKIDYMEVPQIISSLDRTNAGMTAPAQGLCLKKVFYDK